MTYEEAITILAKISGHHSREVQEAIGYAIPAIEKQIPKKPSADMGWQYCGNCGLDMLTDTDREGREYQFCPHCGQHICREETE